MTDNNKYDIILFGVTGFTGKLCCEYLLEHGANYGVSWAVCARNPTKAKKAIDVILERLGKQASDAPVVLTADLVCETPEQEDVLRKIVQQCKVALTCAGPFEKYGTTLVKLCAENGVSYGDITGETDFFRKMIQQHDKTARESGAIILCHCGNDCIPNDLMVYEMHQFAIKNNAELTQVKTFDEFPDSATFSGGTAATAIYQLGKNRNAQDKPAFDPLLTVADGSKSEYGTKNISAKSAVVDSDIGCSVGPWIMAPVMVNCVRRSNSLLQYSKEFQYGDAMIQNSSWSAWAKNTAFAAGLGAAIYIPPLRSLLPQPGEGPDRETMENGYLTVHARGIMKKKEESGDETKITGKFHFNKDIGYLYTAALLVETGMVLLSKVGKTPGGVLTPAVALGSDLTKRILEHMDTSLEVKEAD